MMSETKAPDALYIGCAPETGAVQRLIDFHPDEMEVRIEALVPPDAGVLMVTRQNAHPSEIDKRLAATSVGISASTSTKDPAAARREVDRAIEADWTTLNVVINGASHPATVLQLLSGNWAGYAQYKCMGIAFGSRNLDLRDLRLAAVNPADLVEGSEGDS
jgi:hypothetical protein